MFTKQFAFDVDGRLPGVTLRGSPDAIDRVYRFMREHAELHADPTAWDEVNDREVDLRAVARPEELIQRGLMENIYHCVNDFRPAAGVALPRLGLALHAGQLTIDWAGGRAWEAHKIDAFLEWLLALPLEIDVQLDDAVPPAETAEFALAFAARRARTVGC